VEEDEGNERITNNQNTLFLFDYFSQSSNGDGYFRRFHQLSAAVTLSLPFALLRLNKKTTFIICKTGAAVTADALKSN
jgi:hypothetical protein